MRLTNDINSSFPHGVDNSDNVFRGRFNLLEGVIPGKAEFNCTSAKDPL
jgi:hypothetical protein